MKFININSKVSDLRKPLTINYRAERGERGKKKEDKHKSLFQSV